MECGNESRSRRALIVMDDDTLRETSLPIHPRRNHVVWELISEYCSLQASSNPAVVVVPRRRYDSQHLHTAIAAFHDTAYIDFLMSREGNIDERRAKRLRSEEEALPRLSLLPMTLKDREFCGEGCQPFVGLWQHCVSTIEATLTAVHSLIGSANNTWCALNWWGGRHHAHIQAASGFCFVNDVVIAAQELRKYYRRVLVVDVDAHHGDGTEEAFFHDKSVFTFSVHRKGVGVFPGSGSASSIGDGFGQGYCLNIPLAEGSVGSAVVDEIYNRLTSCYASFRPEAVIMVCGADALQGDPLGGLNFTIADIQRVARALFSMALESDAKVLVLGAGGYVDASTAKLCAAITNDVIIYTTEQNVDERLRANLLAPDAECGVPVPDTLISFSLYAPSFTMGALPAPVVPKVFIDAMNVSDEEVSGDESSQEIVGEDCDEENDDEEERGDSD